ncbi:MAG TPA: ribonuclease P [Nanoarchaeota archaeon]|nr:ribonuclease P [Nanoarchaeota archaeon]
MRYGIKRKKEKQGSIARERIEKLFIEAEKAFPKEPALSKRYVELARKISTRTNTAIPRSLKGKFCKKCNAFLVSGKNARARTRAGKIISTCLECGSIRVVPFVKEKKDKIRKAR